MIPPRPCKYCGSDKHTSINCFQKPRKALRSVSKKKAVKDRQMRLEWFSRPENQPDVNMQWSCYLRIAPGCEIFVTRETLNLEHTKSKVRYPQFRFDVDKLKPSCNPCNKLKGSLDLEDLVDKYPHVQQIIDRLGG